MPDTRVQRPSTRRSVRGPRLALPMLTLLVPGCYTPVDASSFVDGTNELRAAVTVAGDAVLDELRRNGISESRYQPLRAAWDRRDVVLAAMVRYGSTLVAVAADEFANTPGNRLTNAFVDLQRESQAVAGSNAQLRLPRSAARALRQARERWTVGAAARDLQPLVDGVVDEFEVELQDLDAELASAEQELVEVIRNRDAFADLDPHRTRLREFLRGVDVAEASLEDVLKAGNVATILRNANALAATRDEEIRALARRFATMRDLATETRVALRTWSLAHASVANALVAERPVAVKELQAASDRIEALVATLRRR